MNIIEFIDTGVLSGKQPSRRVELYPMQRILLKLMYGIALSDNEREQASSNGLPTVQREYGEVVGIMGRRSGKDFMTSLIAAHEVHRLLELGSPHAHYSLSPTSPITIMVVCSSGQMARVVYSEIYNVIANAPYFRKRKWNSRQGNIRFATQDGGEVQVLVTNSSASDINGVSASAVIFHEMASFRNEQVRTFLGPVVRTFGSDGKIFTFSTPRSTDSLLYRIYSQPGSDTLAFSLPTWAVNPRHTEESLRLSSHGMERYVFDQEFGALFNVAQPEPIYYETLAAEDSAVSEINTEEPKSILTQHTYSYKSSRKLDMEED